VIQVIDCDLWPVYSVPNVTRGGRATRETIMKDDELGQVSYRVTREDDGARSRDDDVEGHMRTREEPEGYRVTRDEPDGYRVTREDDASSLFRTGSSTQGE